MNTEYRGYWFMNRHAHNLSKHLWGVVLLLFTLLPQALHSQEAKITTSITPDEIQIGEVAIIDIVIRTSDLENTYFVNPIDTAQLRAEALSFEITDTIDVDNTTKELHARMAVTSFDSTLVVIPAFGVRVGDQESFANPLTLKVNLPKVDMEHPDQFNDIKGVWALPYTWGEIFLMALPWLLGVLVLIGGFLGYKYYRRRKEKLALRPAPPSPSPSLSELQRYEMALEALNARHLPEQGLQREYYTELDILSRTFVRTTTGIDTLEMTSRQLLRALSQAGFRSLVDEQKLDELTERVNLSKFAKVVYTPNEAESDSKHWLRVAQALYQATQEKAGATETEKKGGNA